ncbi:MAG: hypothetical protein HZC14_02075 [Candidatus Niyogibacteria bacterium]|nr:hypothetical protein [Candidatus Niyogibacteria bacterium]
MRILKYYISLFVIFLSLGSAHNVFAASIYVLPEQGNFSRGETLSVDIKIDSEGEDINAVQGTIHWPANVLEFIDASKDSSVFNFWVTDPVLSGDASSLNFIGGTAKGISGGALQVLKLRFKTIGVGTADMAVLDAAVIASDGRGTNILSKIKGANYKVGEVGAAPALPTAPPTPGITPQPARVERPAVPAKNLPQKPELQVPLYPDEALWHNRLGGVVALWNMPGDVTAVAVSLDHSPSSVPSIAEKELTTGKSFGILEDGIWYIHAQFKNNIGWGPITHYRMVIDTKPPLSFEITAPEGETTDNPAPVIQFKTSDALSGLKEYQIKIDNNEIIKIAAAGFTGSLTLPLQVPGNHTVVVKAVDQAENSIGDNIALEILPIPSPIITFVTAELFSEEARGLTIKGTALPNVNVLLQIQQKLNGTKGEVAAKGVARADDRGNWDFTFDEPLRNGNYAVLVKSQDVRGALSLEVESVEIQVKSKPIIQFGSLQLGKGGAAILLLLIMIIGFGGGIWFYKKRQEKLAMRVSFTESEITKIFQLLKGDVEQLSKARETATTGDDEYAIKRLQENIQKMEGYLKKGLEKIKK